jgi:COX assembly protein 1
MVREKLTCGHMLALRSKMKARTLKECDVMVAKFAECAKGRTLSVIWSCRSQARELNNCVHQ